MSKNLENDPDWQTLNEIEDRLEELGKRYGEEIVIIYSAYDSSGDVYRNNLDDIAFEGTYQVIAEGDDYFGSAAPYIGAVYTDPTWLELAWEANRSIKVTGDQHHVFFEGAEVKNGKIVMYFGS